MYKAIIFDLDNTLLNYSQSELQCMRQTIQAHRLLGEEQDEGIWEKFWNAYLQSNYAHWMSFVNKEGRHRSIEDVLIQSFRDTLKETVQQDEQHSLLAQTYWDYFCNTCIYEEGAREVLHAVSGNYQLGIVSNGIGAAQRKRLAAGEIDHLFDSIVVSDEVGVRKPHKEIFEFALQQLKVNSSEVLFIGDSLHDDYAGAQNSGVDFCYYNRNRQAVSQQFKPRYTINSITELLQVI